MNEEAIQKAAVIVKQFEGFSAVPYLCPAGYWTIGYGTLCSKDSPRITELAASDLLLSRLRRDYTALLGVIGDLTITSNRVAALLSWIYNLGIGAFKKSTMLKFILVSDWENAAKECTKWVHGGSKKLPGLVKRRGVEAKLLRSG